MLVYGEDWDQRVAEGVEAARVEMRELSARMDNLMLDFCDRRSELAEHTAGGERSDVAEWINDPDYGKALDLWRRWERLNRSLESFHKAWARQLRHLPGNETAKATPTGKTAK
jgi:hypothetical protein